MVKKSSTQIKKRGRKIKKIVDEIDEETSDEFSEENKKKSNTQKAKMRDDEMSAVIIQLPINQKQLDKLEIEKPVKKEKKNKESNKELDEIFKNDIPLTKSGECSRCEQHEKILKTLKEKLNKYEQKDRNDKSIKLHYNKLNLRYIGRKKPIKGKVKCWWDTNTFEGIPFHLPESYYNNGYDVTGYFCSPNCALSYNIHRLKDSKVDLRTSLLFSLVRELKGLKSDEPLIIKDAEPPEILEDHGGTKTIIQYRAGFIQLQKSSIVYIPPLKPIQLIVEEKIIEDEDTADKKYIIQRKKPLKSKRKTILDSMGVEADDDFN
jgi:hypothetical protein